MELAQTRLQGWIVGSSIRIHFTFRLVLGQSVVKLMGFGFCFTIRPKHLFADAFKL